MKRILSGLLVVALSSCSTMSSYEKSKLSLNPEVVSKVFERAKYENGLSLISDSKGDIYLLVKDKFKEGAVVHNVNFLSENQVCEFEFSHPISGLNINNAMKVATRADFEQCHPYYKGFDLISTNRSMSFLNMQSRSKGIAAQIEWQSNNTKRELLISTSVYFVDGI